jgi:hypothetical protein
MIKLTQVLFDIKDSARKKASDIEAIYEEACNEAEVLGKSLPSPPPPYKFKDTDYDKKEFPLYLDEKIIIAISSNFDGDTQVTCNNLVAYLVKESPLKVFNLKSKIA